jgi:hypothetical protein
MDANPHQNIKEGLQVVAVSVLGSVSQNFYRHEFLGAYAMEGAFP